MLVFRCGYCRRSFQNTSMKLLSAWKMLECQHLDSLFTGCHNVRIGLSVNSVLQSIIISDHCWFMFTTKFFSVLIVFVRLFLSTMHCFDSTGCIYNTRFSSRLYSIADLYLILWRFQLLFSKSVVNFVNLILSTSAGFQYLFVCHQIQAFVVVCFQRSSQYFNALRA